MFSHHALIHSHVLSRGILWAGHMFAGALRAAGNAAVAAGVLDADGMSGNEATASISIGYDGDDPEITFLAPQV